MEYVVVAAVAALASCLSFFSGFGLGTLLLPAFALFYPVPVAVALSAAVHFLNGMFKLVLVGKHAKLGVVVRFGLPAMVAALIGARVLLWLSDMQPLHQYRLGGREHQITPVELAVAATMLVFAGIELSGRLERLSVSTHWLPVGGIISGFFGGLSGHQGAFRSVFLLRAGLDKEAFVATGVVIAALIDVSRLWVYASGDAWTRVRENGWAVAVPAAAAFAGALLGNRLLRKVTLRSIQAVVALMLIAIAIALGTGLI